MEKIFGTLRLVVETSDLSAILNEINFWMFDRRKKRYFKVKPNNHGDTFTIKSEVPTQHQYEDLKDSLKKYHIPRLCLETEPDGKTLEEFSNKKAGNHFPSTEPTMDNISLRFVVNEIRRVTTEEMVDQDFQYSDAHILNSIHPACTKYLNSVFEPENVSTTKRREFKLSWDCEGWRWDKIVASAQKMENLKSHLAYAFNPYRDSRGRIIYPTVATFRAWGYIG